MWTASLYMWILHINRIPNIHQQTPTNTVRPANTGLFYRWAAYETFFYNSILLIKALKCCLRWKVLKAQNTRLNCIQLCTLHKIHRVHGNMTRHVWNAKQRKREEKMKQCGMKMRNTWSRGCGVQKEWLRWSIQILGGLTIKPLKCLKEE